MGGPPKQNRNSLQATGVSQTMSPSENDISFSAKTCARFWCPVWSNFANLEMLRPFGGDMQIPCEILGLWAPTSPSAPNSLSGHRQLILLGCRKLNLLLLVDSSGRQREVRWIDCPFALGFEGV